MAGRRHEGRGKRESRGRQRKELFVTEGSGERGGRSRGGGETEDQGISGGTGVREKRLVCSHDMTDVLPGTVQSCMLVYPCPSWPGTNKHRHRDNGRDRRDAGSVRSVVGTEDRGDEGGGVGEGAETSGQRRGNMTGEEKQGSHGRGEPGQRGRGRWEKGNGAMIVPRREEKEVQNGRGEG